MHPRGGADLLGECGLGALEGTNLSVGRGTDRPFEHYGAPWVDAKRVCAELNARKVPGVEFLETTFTPRPIPGRPRYPHTDEPCRGFEIRITDRAAYRPVRAVLHALDVLHRAHGAKLSFGRTPRMIGLASIESDLKAGRSPAAIEKAWQADLEKFLGQRRKHLLYK